MPHIEFIRNVFFLETVNGNNRFETIYIHTPKDDKHRRIFCSCDRHRTHALCSHAQAIAIRFKEFCPDESALLPDEQFKKSLWYMLLKPAITQGSPLSSSVKVQSSESTIRILGAHDDPILIGTGDGNAITPLLNRLGFARCGDRITASPVIEKLREFVLSDTERVLIGQGMVSTRQQEENSFWFRIAYHCFMEARSTEIDLRAFIDKESGSLSLRFSSDNPEWSMETILPRPIITEIVQQLHRLAPKACDFSRETTDSELFFSIVPGGDSQWELQAGLIVGEGATATFHRVTDNFTYRQMAYVPSLNRVFPLSMASGGCLGLRLHDQPRMLGALLSRFIENNIEHFSIADASDRQESQIDLFSGGNATNLRRIVTPAIIRSFSSIELEPVALNESECRAIIRYTKGSINTDFTVLRTAHDNGCRFLFQNDAIIDTASDAIAHLPMSGTGVDADGSVTLPRSYLLQFSGHGMTIAISRKNRFSSEIARLLDIAPSVPLRELKTLRSTLRDYQKRAVEWLLFLYDNYFGGLLCDEMGLGKTHEALGALAATLEQRENRAGALIVCPTTVISHWQKLIAEFTPDLRVSIYHGPDRRIEPENNVLITSFGVMRNDIERLSQRMFGIIVFDEIQNLKNRATGYFDAASRLKARSRFGLTGTPVENSVADLKALFDVVLPGYLGDDNAFVEQYLLPIETADDKRVKERFRKLTAPFIMRRMKQDVLKELADKIESHHTCLLSSEQ